MSNSMLQGMQSPSFDTMSKAAQKEQIDWIDTGMVLRSEEPLPAPRNDRFPFLRLSVGKSFYISKWSIFFKAATSSADTSMRRYNSLYRVKYVKIKHADAWEYARIG